MDVKELDRKMQNIMLLKVRRDNIRKQEVEATKELERQKREFQEILEKLDRTQYAHSEYGKVTLVKKMSVTTPKTLDEKRQVRDWLKSKLGDDAPDALMSFNSRTLNSFYNEQVNEYAERGEVLDIPGLTPTEYTQVVYKS